VDGEKGQPQSTFLISGESDQGGAHALREKFIKGKKEKMGDSPEHPKI